MIRLISRLLPSSPVTLAVSGGVDSMALLGFFSRSRNNLTVLFVHHETETSENAMRFLLNHHLIQDTNFIVRYIPEKEIPVGQSSEAFWREARFNIFSSMEHPVVTAHHLDDVIETYLMGLLDGNPKFINPKLELNSGNLVYRPFLRTTKQSLIDWCYTNNISWIEDTTNVDTSYRRNNIRHTVVPSLFAVQPGFHKTFLKMFDSWLDETFNINNK